MVVFVEKEGQRAEAEQVARRLQLSISDDPSDYYLVLENQQWVVRNPKLGPKFVIALNFLKEFEELQKQRVNPKKDLLCRAVGFKGEQPYKVLDGTVGFAKDTIHLLNCGIEVIGFERNPITHLLLESAWHKYPISNRHFDLISGDFSYQWLDLRDQVDCLYLDPMFENTKKKSAPKKYLAFLREISPVDKDIPHLIDSIIQQGVKRLVVKRPINGENLGARPNMTFKGKLIRYDVYTR